MRLFGKRKEEPAQEKPWIEALELNTSSWFQVYSACLGKMLTIQKACGEQVVKDQGWNVHFSEGIICFGSQKYPLQFLGSESSVSNSWLWGWQNVNHFPDRLLQAARQTWETGKRWNLEPLITAKFELDDTFNGHSMAIVACGLSDGYCYYRCPHAQGAAFVAFSEVPGSVFAPVDAQAFISTTLQCVRQFHVDHKLFVEGFLTWNQTKFDWEGKTLIAHFEKDLCFNFEQAGEFLRIASIKAKEL